MFDIDADALSPLETARSLLARYLSTGPKADYGSYLVRQMKCSNILAMSLITGLEDDGFITKPDKAGYRSLKNGERT